MAGVVGLWRVPKKPGARDAVRGVPSAERALALLTAFRQGDGALSLAELAERTGLVKMAVTMNFGPSVLANSGPPPAV